MRLAHFFGKDRGAEHPELVLSFRYLPDDAPFAGVLDELVSPGGFTNHAFRAKYHDDGRPVKNFTADDRLKEVDCW